MIMVQTYYIVCVGGHSYINENRSKLYQELDGLDAQTIILAQAALRAPHDHRPTALHSIGSSLDTDCGQEGRGEKSARQSDMEEGGDQTSPAVQQIRAGEDPDIGPPATHRAKTELKRGQA